jgi:hypothetical protein
VNDRNPSQRLAGGHGEPELTTRQQQLDGQITRMLAERPRVTVPPEFAARVGRAASALPQRSHMRVRWGVLAAVAGAVVLLGAMFWTASATTHSPATSAFPLALQTIYLAEFAVAMYAAVRFSRILN